MDHHRHVWSYPIQFKKNSMQMVVPGPAFLTLGFHILYYILHDLFAKHCAKLMLHTYSIKLMRTWVQMMMKKNSIVEYKPLNVIFPCPTGSHFGRAVSELNIFFCKI